MGCGDAIPRPMRGERLEKGEAREQAMALKRYLCNIQAPPGVILLNREAGANPRACLIFLAPLDSAQGGFHSRPRVAPARQKMECPCL